MISSVSFAIFYCTTLKSSRNSSLIKGSKFKPESTKSQAAGVGMGAKGQNAESPSAFPACCKVGLFFFTFLIKLTYSIEIVVETC